MVVTKSLVKSTKSKSRTARKSKKSDASQILAMLSRFQAGTGKSFWQLIRLILQSYSGKVLYLVTDYEYALELDRIKYMSDILGRTQYANLVELWNPENVQVMKYSDESIKSVIDGLSSAKAYDALSDKLRKLGYSRTGLVFSHELLEAIAKESK